jgi:hypothetical protein
VKGNPAFVGVAGFPNWSKALGQRGVVCRERGVPPETNETVRQFFGSRTSEAFFHRCRKGTVVMWGSGPPSQCLESWGPALHRYLGKALAPLRAEAFFFTGSIVILASRTPDSLESS